MGNITHYFNWVYRHFLDENGRLQIPSEVRHMMQEEDKRIFVLTKGLHGCLFAFPKTAWDVRMAIGFPDHLPKKEKYARLQALSSWSINCVLDSQNRVKIPDELIAFANLDREVVIAGVADRLEFWDSKAYDEYLTALDAKPDEVIEDTLI